MARIAFIGAGSVVFTRSLVRDLVTTDRLKGSTIVLMDINKQRLEFARQAVQILIDRSGAPAKVETTMDRRKALKGADAVVCTILAGGVNIWRHDIEIPRKYGINTNIGDTRSVSGIFRTLRTVPVMLDICRDIERLCPDAILLNYTNPMSMLCRAMQRESDVNVTGLCHSVQGTASKLAEWIGAKMEDVTYVCAGLNHMAWYIDYRVKGKDALGKIRKAAAAKENYNREIVRNEMCIALGYYVTESSGHNSEYNWWFRKRPDLIRKYCKTRKESGWNPGAYGYILKGYLKREETWRQDMRRMLKETQAMSLEGGVEYAANIINAWTGGPAYQFNGNVPNTGIITNLPQDACVEVPVLTHRGKLTPLYVGALPPQCAALNQITVAVEEMAVEAAISGDPMLVYQACCYDPLTAAVLDLRTIRKMVAEMLKKNQRYLPQFKTVRI